MTEKPTRPELVMLGGEPTGWRPALKSAARSRSVQIAGALAVVGLLAMGAQSSGADYNDLIQIGVNAKTGTLDINVDGQQGNPDPYPVDLGQFKPGDSGSKTVEVRNTGSLPAVVTATMTGQGTAALGAQLDATLTAAPTGGTPVTSSAKANGAQLDAFTVPAGGSVPLTVTLTLPSSTGNDWQGKEDKLVLTLDAVQE